MAGDPKKNPGLDSEGEVGRTPLNVQKIGLAQKKGDLGAPSAATVSPLFHVERQTIIDGVEMGVLDNGVPYLTESGLARMCGIHRWIPRHDAWNDAEEARHGRDT